MKGKKRILAMVLTLVIVTGTMLTGCQDSESPEKDSKSKSPENEITTDDDGRKMEGNLYLEGLPLVKEQESFSILIDEGGNVEDVQNWPLIKLLEEQTNVKVNWEIYPYEVTKEKKNLLLNSGDYPDVMGGWILGKTDIVKYGSKEEMFIPLDELFEKYAPKMMEVLDLPDIRRDMTLPDGHIYSPPYVIEEPEMIFSPWINQAWLDTLNLKMPTNTDELYDVLVAFRDKDPNGNNKKDEIPFTSRNDNFYNWFSFFGYPAPENGLTMVEGVPTYTANMDYYKEGINYFNKLYKEGLMDPELFTQDMSNYNGKGKGEDALYGACILYYPTDISPGVGEDGLNIRSEEYVPLPPITSKSTDKPMWRRGSDKLTLFPTQLVITDNAKNPATIVRWLDNLYQLDNSVQARWGVFDVTLKKTSDGYEQMEKTDITGSPTYKEFIGAMPKFVPLTEVAKLKKDKASAANDAQNNEMDKVWANNMTKEVPAVWLSAKETTSIATIETDLSNYVKQKRAEWITGSADVNKEWDAYKAQLDKLGLQKFVEVYTNAINKTLAK